MQNASGEKPSPVCAVRVEKNPALDGVIELRAIQLHSRSLRGIALGRGCRPRRIIGLLPY